MDVLDLILSWNYTDEAVAGGGGGGADGVGIESIEQTTTSTESGGENIITVTKTNGTADTFSVYNGAQGETGPQGPRGETGPQGPAGADGLDNQHVFSTEEQIVGTWIDGKPIYEITVVTTTASAVDTTTLIYSWSVPVDFPVYIQGRVNRYANGNPVGYGFIPITWGESTGSDNYVALNLAASGIREKHGLAAMNSAPIIITAQYTKTTDEATNPIPDATALNNAYDEGVQSA